MNYAGGRKEVYENHSVSTGNLNQLTQISFMSCEMYAEV
jgi:hypothetical protein